MSGHRPREHRHGELLERSVSPITAQVVAFLDDVPSAHGPVLVTYEPGPTGYGLARALLTAEHACQVAAPSKLLRPAGDRVKTDARDALLLAQLARNDDIVAGHDPVPCAGVGPGPGPRP